MAERSARALNATSALPRATLRRYARHLLVPEIGVDGQERLSHARVLVVGAGGLGSPVLQYLAAAGVGRIGIVDDDAVDPTNLQRQVLFDESDVGESKALAAARHLRAQNGALAIDVFPIRFDRANGRALVAPYDLVVDCTDTFGARYAISDAARLEGKTDVYASIFRFDGQVSVFAPGGPCYRCLFPQAPPEGSVPTCAEGGVLGVLAGVVGTLQASEALKWILRVGEPLVGRLALVDALGARVRDVTYATDPHCPLDGDHAVARDTPLDALPATASDVRERTDVAQIDAAELDAFLATHPNARLLDVREAHEAVFGAFPNAIAIPASALDRRLHELDTAHEYVVACRVGARSATAVARLRDAGFGRVRHLRDGLLAYAALANDFEAL